MLLPTYDVLGIIIIQYFIQFIVEMGSGLELSAFVE